MPPARNIPFTAYIPFNLDAVLEYVRLLEGRRNEALAPIDPKA
jgi:hypothetical protein